METIDNADTMTYQQRIDALRATKLAQTRDKQELIGSMDHDDHGLILPPPDRRKIVQTMSSSGMPITDCLIEGFEVESNHPSGGFFGPRAVGENFRGLLECHPVYIDPVSSLAGGYMVNFMSYRKPHWNPDFDFGGPECRDPEIQPAARHRRDPALLPGSADWAGPGLGRAAGEDPPLPPDQRPGKG